MKRVQILTLAVFAVFAFVPVPLAAEPNLVLGPDQVLRGDFEQLRQLSGFETPLTSSGRFVVAGDRGVLWRTEEPFQFDLVITPTRFVQVLPGEPPVDVLPNQAGSVNLFGVFSELLRGAAVDQTIPSFDATPIQIPGAAWGRRLTPTTAQLASQIETITVAGSDFVEGVEVRRTSGDMDTLKFSAQSLSSDPLTEDEAALLDMAAGGAASP